MDRRNFIEVGRVLADLISQTGGYLPEPVDEARFPQLAADIRALARLAIAEAAEAEAEAEAEAAKGRVVGFQREVDRRDFPQYE